MANLYADNYSHRLQFNLKKAQEKTSPVNFDLIQGYDNEMATLGLKKSTRVKQLTLLVNMTMKIEKDWTKITKTDIDRLVRTIMDEYGDEQAGESETTRDFKKTLKPFFRWVKFGTRDFAEVGDPPELKSIKLKQVNDKIVREQLLTEDDHKKLLNACAGNLRDKAFLDVHYEAGTRPGEILSLQIKHVKFDDKGAIIHVDGKTGPRPIRLVLSVPNLAKWIDAHPLKHNSEAPLWILFGENHYGEPMRYSSAIGLLRRCLKRAKINKKINLKLFRHTAATRLSKHLSEPTMRLRHGWTKNSTMPARYVHLNGSDVDDAIMKMYGIEQKSSKDKPERLKMCPICKVLNSVDSEICYQCGKPLDLKKAIELETHASEQNFNTNKIAAKFLIQMLQTGQIPKIPKDELNSLIQSLNL